MSMKLTPIASRRTSASCGSGCGLSISRSVSSSGPPVRPTTIAFTLVEFGLRRRLGRGDAAGGDLRARVALAAPRRPAHAAQVVDLSRVREGVGHGSLEEDLRDAAEGAVAREEVIERLERREEARRILLPRGGLRVLP